MNWLSIITSLLSKILVLKSISCFKPLARTLALLSIKVFVSSSWGDNISPSKIENLLCLNEKIKQSFVYGDKKTYLVALIVSENEENKKEIEFYLENLNKNLSLVEKVKKFKLIKEEFTIENGMLTPTLKLKRKKILEKYKEDLEKFY